MKDRSHPKEQLMHRNTRVVHAGSLADRCHGALSNPIVPASTFRQENVDEDVPYEYSRTGNPTREALEQALAELEGGTQGFAFSSGVAAITAALTSVLKAGDHVVAPEQIYGGTYRLLTRYLNRFGITTTFVDMTDVRNTAAAITPATKVLYLETPSNPTLVITDVAAMTALARERGLVTIADNTFLTPLRLRPIELGVDIVVHSASKFLGGHSDLIAGAVVTRTEELGKAVYFVQFTAGGILSPENSWLLSRGIKTLSVRFQREEETASSLARWLVGQPWVEHVYYPGLPEHPGHSIMAAQASGFGAVLSFTTRTLAQAKQLMRRVKVWSVAVSLGGVESILTYPVRMSHASIPEPERRRLGITDTLIRLSPGLEEVEDLKEDLAQAVAGIPAA
jgi:cystathionine beta-lyase/cystathionine gamma-synthase